MLLARLPAALAARGENVAVVLPAYRENVYPNPTREAYRNLWIPIGPGFMVDIYQTSRTRRHFYFVHCPIAIRSRRNLRSRRRAISRTTISASPFSPWPRSASRAISFRPDIIHAARLAGRARARLSARTFRRRPNIHRRQDPFHHSQSRLPGPLRAASAFRKSA